MLHCVTDLEVWWSSRADIGDYLIVRLSDMRPSLGSAVWIVVGLCTVAAAMGLLVGLLAEWGLIAGALSSGQRLDLVLIIESALVALVIVMLIGATRRPRAR